VTCQEAGTLMHPYLDGELNLVNGLEIEAHVAGCPSCAREEASLRALRTAIVDGGLYHQAPLQLERRVRSSLRGARRAERGWSWALPSYGWAGAAAVGALLVAILVSGVLPTGTQSEDLIPREVVDNHLRSLKENHLADVLSSNQHTVKPWFDGRLNFAPPVKDFTRQGFPLIGGRLDYLDNRPVAAVVYRRRRHVINLFILPAQPGADTEPISQTLDGFNIVHWTDSGMSYWTISSLSGGELNTFTELVRGEHSKSSSAD
jgi:anti-sigma factor RsiW